MATQNNKNGRFLGHFQTVSFGLVGKAQEVKTVSSYSKYSIFQNKCKSQQSGRQKKFTADSSLLYRERGLLRGEDKHSKTKARRVITIEEKIERQSAEVAKVKKKYDEELDKLNIILEKKKEMKSKELLEAFSKSSRTYTEIMNFLKSK